MNNIKQISLIFILLILFSCKKTKNKGIVKTNLHQQTFEHTLKKHLIMGNFWQIDDNVSLLLAENNIYYFNTSGVFSDNKFLLHFIREDNTFEQHDFFGLNHIVSDSLKPNLSNLAVIHRRLNFDNYKAVRTGQFIRKHNEKTSNIWVKQDLVENIYNRTSPYKNQLLKIFNENILNNDFINSLKHDVFFKNEFGFYIMLNDNELYIITDQIKNLKDKFMFHLIRKDNSFKNLSFSFEDFEFQMYLDMPFNNLKIAKLTLPSDELFTQIRIGQFNKTGNIWAQQFKVEEIFANKLLRYSGEFDFK